MIIGVLALQGDFSKHEEVLRSLGVFVKQVRKPGDLKDCAALIIPGGESTTLFRQMDFIQLRQTLIDFSREKNIFGTCAGLILMSHAIEGSDQKPLNILDITLERNAFGRQIDSFKPKHSFTAGSPHPVQCLFHPRAKNQVLRSGRQNTGNF